MIPGRRIFWSFIATAVLVVVFGAPVLLFDIFMRREVPWLAELGGTFAAMLLLLALLRSRLGARLPDALGLALCALPFFLALLLGEFVETPAELAPLLDDHGARRIEAWSIIDTYVLGALFSLGLVMAEVVTWSRFATGFRHGLAKGIVLALPFQLPWLIRLPGELGWLGSLPSGHWFFWEEWLQNIGWRPAELVVGFFALVLVPLSWIRGGTQTPSVLVGLTVATFFVFVLKEGEFVRLALGPHGCGPATDLERLEFHFSEVLSFEFMEAIPWLPGLLSAGAAWLWLRRPIPIGPAAVALLICAAHGAVSRLERLTDLLSDSRQANFIPRGRGRAVTEIKVSEEVVLDREGKVVMNDPLADEEALGALLAREAESTLLRSCWHKPSRSYASGMVVTVSFDARLSPAQELRVASAARRHGVAGIHLIEGEDRSEPGSRYLLSTHLRRLVAGTREATFLLSRDAVPTECDQLTSRTTMDLSGSGSGDDWVLETPETNDISGL